MSKQIDDILNYNDKCILVLYSYYNRKSNEYVRLLNMYGENIVEEYRIRLYLMACKYLYCETIFEKGESCGCTPIKITELGINALKDKVFQSETKKRRCEDNERLIRVVSLIISSIGGLLGFISFFK